MEKNKAEKLKATGVKAAKFLGKFGASMTVGGLVAIAVPNERTGVSKVIVDVSKFVAATALSYKLMDVVEEGVDRYVEDWGTVIEATKELVLKHKDTSEKTEG